MDSTTLALAATIARIILISTKNLISTVQEAKFDDGKVTSDELLGIAFDAAILSCEDLGAGDLAVMIKGN
jgi:phosphatidylglycerophosphatase A